MPVIMRTLPIRKHFSILALGALLVLPLLSLRVDAFNALSTSAPDQPFPSLLQTLPWPVRKKGVENCHLFFNEEDAVRITKRKAGIRRCTHGSFPMHLGLDIVGQEGEKVYAVTDGTIKKIWHWGTTWGGYVLTEHAVNDQRFTLLYGHISPHSALVQGHNVTQGELLGELYDVTDATNDLNHLHLGMRRGPYDPKLSHRGVASCNGDLLGFVDPLRYLKSPAFTVIDRPLTVPPGWRHGRGLDLYQGDGYYYSFLDDSTLTFESATLPPGSYEVYVRFPPYEKASDQVKIEVSSGNVSSVGVFDQTTQASRGRWLLHSRQLLKDTSTIKTTFHSSPRGPVAADAVLIKATSP